jgi:hypothetical protein
MNGILVKRSMAEKRKADNLWLQANDVSHPAEKKALAKLADASYNEAHKIKGKLNK